MSKWSKGVILLLVWGVMPPLYAASYTLEDCLRIAEEKSSELKDYREQLKKADAQVDEVYGRALPSIDFTAQYQWEDYTAASKSGLTPSFLDSTSADFNPTAAMTVGYLGGSMAPSAWQLNAGFTATQILFAQGKVATGLKIAKENRNRMNVEYDQILRNLHRDVRSLFMQSLFLQEGIVTYDSALAQIGRYRKLAENSYQSGLVSELELLRAQVSEEDLRAGRQQMVSSLLLLCNSLLQKIGLEFDPDVQFIGELEEELPQIDLSTAIDKALANRQELRQLEYAKKIQEELVTIERSDYLPLLVLGGSAMKVGNGEEWNDLRFATDYRVFLQAKWNIFNGMQTRNKVVQAKTEKRRLEITLENARNGIRLEVESLWATYDEALKRLPVRLRQEELSKKALTIAEKSWEVGGVTQLELLDAQLNWRNARLELLRAQVDAQIAYRALYAAQGIW